MRYEQPSFPDLDMWDSGHVLPRINDNGAINADIVASLPGNALLAIGETPMVLYVPGGLDQSTARMVTFA